MFKLHQSTTFKQEYEHFKNRINKIENPQAQDELNVLLSKLVYEVKNLDNLHNELSVTNRLPIGTNDVRSNINAVRNQLIHKLKDWEHFINQTNI